MNCLNGSNSTDCREIAAYLNWCSVSKLLGGASGGLITFDGEVNSSALTPQGECKSDAGYGIAKCLDLSNTFPVFLIAECHDGFIFFGRDAPNIVSLVKRASLCLKLISQV